MMEDSFDAKQSDIIRIQKAGLTLTSRDTILQTTKELEQSRDNLKVLLKNLRGLLITSLEQWRMYHECLHNVSNCLGKAEYSVSRVGMATGTLESLEFQLNRFKVRRNKYKKVNQ